MTNVFIDNRTGEKVNVTDERAILYKKNPAIFTEVKSSTSQESEVIIEDLVEETATEAPSDAPEAPKAEVIAEDKPKKVSKKKKSKKEDK